MGPYSILLLGPPAVQGPGGPIPLPNIKAQALLWYLAEQSDRAFFRAHLASLLWDSESETDRRNSLNSTLSRMRKSLPVWPFVSDRERLAWNPELGLTVDTEQLSTLLRTVRRAARTFGAGSSPADRDRLAAASSLWRGPFLAGFEVPGDTLYDEWLDQKRHLYETLILDTLSQLIQMDEMAGAWPAMASRARQAIAIDPLQETFHRWLMTALYQVGDRAAALAQYSECRRLLSEELGAEPDPATSALRDTIAKGRLLRPTLMPARSLTAVEPPVAPPARGFTERQSKGEAPEAAASTPTQGVAAAGRPMVIKGGQAPAALSGPAPRTARTVSGRRPPLVGREKELELLGGALASPDRSGHPVVLLCGEEGMGKSRLVEELEGRWHRGQTPGSWFTAHCAEELRHLPLAPVVAALDGAVHEEAGPDESRRRSIQALARFMESLPHPTVLVIEDSQWADADTWAFIGFMGRRINATSPVILVTARTGDLSEEGDAIFQRLQHEGVLTRVDLGPLPVPAVQELVVAAGGSRSPSLGEGLRAFTGGNPWLALETLRAMGEQGRPAGEQGVNAGDSMIWPVPTAVRTAMSNRLARCSPAARELAFAASVHPEGLPFDTLLQTAELTEAVALEALETLVRSGVLEERAGSGDVAYRCDLMRLAVASSMSRARWEMLRRKTVSR